MAGYRYIGHTDVFDENVEQWTTYVERFEHFVKANDIEEDKKDALRDRLVYGLNTEAIQKRLLTEAALTFPKAVEIAVSMETVAREMQQLSNALKVHALTLNKVEWNYAQIEREALSIIFGVRKFHHYLYGRKFTLLTDHRTLTTILSPSKAIPSMAAARMQRWALLLAAHDYTIQYREASHHGNGDGLSRLPIPTSPKEKSMAVDRFHIRHLEVLPVNCKEICGESRTDHVLAQVVEMVSKSPGWRQHTGTIHQQKE
ncbi:hypothetical protein AOLI_G00046250 [Acnodon oligacanthus]